jgi:hypothetical protein
MACVLPVAAHLSYTGRNYGTFTGLTSQTSSISGQSVPGAFGWADGTDADFANQHDQTYFRFNLQRTMLVTLTVSAADPTVLNPGYSIFRGLGHTAPPDYDYTDLSIAYLSALPGPPKEGAFNALETWKMGNEAGTKPEDLSTFTYVAHAADGTSEIFGSATGIVGDGVADGTVTRTFLLEAGDYTVAIGGANYFKQDDYTARAIFTSLMTSPVPEPSSVFLIGSGVLLTLGWRRGRGPAAVCG